VDDITARIAQFAADLTYAEIPDRARSAAKRSLVDSLGVALAAHDADAVAIATAVAPNLPAPVATGRLLGRSAPTTSAEAAAFANAVMIRYLDLNDHLPNSHPSDCLGVYLGAGESLKLSGVELITAMAVTYEVMNALQLSSGARKRGIDQPWAMGIAVAAGLGNARGLSATQIGHAVGIMAASGVALRVVRTGEISKWKAAATGNAARNALHVVSLVEAGMTGPARAFDGRMGVFGILGEFTPPPIGPREHILSIADTDIKCWPVCYALQGSVWAALALRDKVAFDDVRSIQIWTHANAADEAEPMKYDPRSRETADHSMPYVVTKAYQNGAVGPQDFEPTAYRDPSLRPAMRKIAIAPDADIEAALPHDLIVRMQVESNSGDVHEVEIRNPKGHGRNPLTDSDVSDKATRLLTPVLGERRTAEALRWWWAVESADDLGAGLDLLALP
jgi:2-methylcitrate dehydratase